MGGGSTSHLRGRSYQRNSCSFRCVKTVGTSSSSPAVSHSIAARASSAARASCLASRPTVVDMVADRMTREEILGAYPDLQAEDIEEALHYAAEAVRERELPLVAAG